MNRYFDLQVLYTDGEKLTVPKVNRIKTINGVLIVGVYILHEGVGVFKEVVNLPICNIKSYKKEYND